MPKLTVSILGTDCPGIIATVSKLMEMANCNITTVSQTILAGEFASIYMIDAPQDLKEDILREQLHNGLIEANFDLFVVVRPSNSINCSNPEHAQPFVITVDGQDRIGLIAIISNILFQYQVNIENMKFILDVESESHALFLFEIMVPQGINTIDLKNALNEKAKLLNIRVSMQHRNIFEAIHRILPV